MGTDSRGRAVTRSRMVTDSRGRAVTRSRMVTVSRIRAVSISRISNWSLFGKGHEKCPEMKVHNDTINESESQKYLGDMMDQSGSIQATINRRKTQGD